MQQWLELCWQDVVRRRKRITGNWYSIPGKGCSPRRCWISLRKKKELKLSVPTLTPTKPCWKRCSSPMERIMTLSLEMTILLSRLWIMDWHKSWINPSCLIMGTLIPCIRASSMTRKMNIPFLMGLVFLWLYMTRSRWTLKLKATVICGIQNWKIKSPPLPATALLKEWCCWLWEKAWMKRILQWLRKQGKN